VIVNYTVQPALYCLGMPKSESTIRFAILNSNYIIHILFHVISAFEYFIENTN